MNRNSKHINCCVGLRTASVFQGNKHTGMNHNKKKSPEYLFLGAPVKVNKCRNKTENC